MITDKATLEKLEEIVDILNDLHQEPVLEELFPSISSQLFGMMNEIDSKIDVDVDIDV